MALLGDKQKSLSLLQSVPRPEDPLWTKSLIQIPKVTYSMIYEFLVDRKVSRKRINKLEALPDIRAEKLIHKEESEDVHVPAEYTRTLNKGYRFFLDGHVQDIKYHPMDHKPDYVCILSRVLPSMRKDRVYVVNIVFQESTCAVTTAYCSCPAGLSGYCNHVTATLYCLEDYIHLGLQEDEKSGCTDRLQTWNQPRMHSTTPRPTDSVVLTKKVFGVQKRPKVVTINNWDCRPTCRRIVDPNKARCLRERLCFIQNKKMEKADEAVYSAKTVSEIKKALQAKSMLKMYGTSGYLQILDDEAAPLNFDRQEQLKKEREKRLSRAAEKKRKLLQEFETKELHVIHDHTYAAKLVNLTTAGKDLKHPAVNQHQVTLLYNSLVLIDAAKIKDLEKQTQSQANSDLWHHERRLRITASMMKEVCHRRDSTDCKAFLLKKLVPRSIHTAAIHYGNQHEQDAVTAYKQFQHRRHRSQIHVESCGLFVSSSEPWLAASPDRIVTDPLQSTNQCRGCLEVKCPILCKQKSIADVSRDNSSFCIVEKSGKMVLSSSHSYYYQIQTQMYVTNLPWCDFVVWTPVEDLFVQRVYYCKSFMEEAISKARSFYFNIFLPSAVPYFIISQDASQSVEITDVIKSSVPPPDRVQLPNVIKSTVPPPDKVKPLATNSSDIEVISSRRHRTLPLDYVLTQLKLAQHKIRGDGSCLYHAIAHQAGFIEPASQGNTVISNHLRFLVVKTMTEHPDVRLEDGLTMTQWLEKKQKNLNVSEWGGDLEIRLMAIALHRDIVVLTSGTDGSYGRRFPCKAPPHCPR